jgi:hypothetical protein
MKGRFAFALLCIAFWTLQNVQKKKEYLKFSYSWRRTVKRVIDWIKKKEDQTRAGESSFANVATRL